MMTILKKELRIEINIEQRQEKSQYIFIITKNYGGDDYDYNNKTNNKSHISPIMMMMMEIKATIFTMNLTIVIQEL